MLYIYEKFQKSTKKFRVFFFVGKNRTFSFFFNAVYFRKSVKLSIKPKCGMGAGRAQPADMFWDTRSNQFEEDRVLKKK